MSSHAAIYVSCAVSCTEQPELAKGDKMLIDYPEPHDAVLVPQVSSEHGSGEELRGRGGILLARGRGGAKISVGNKNI